MPFINLTKTVEKAEEMRKEFNDNEFEEFFMSILCMYRVQREKGYKTRYPWMKEINLEG